VDAHVLWRVDANSHPVAAAAVKNGDGDVAANDDLLANTASQYQHAFPSVDVPMDLF